MTRPPGVAPALVSAFSIDQPKLRGQWAADGTVIAPAGARPLGEFLKSEHARWADVVKRAAIKPD